MTSDIRINYRLTVPANFGQSAAAPAAIIPPAHKIPLPESYPVQPGWINSLQRLFVPHFASGQDKKISEYFIRFFKDSFASENISRENLPSMLALAEQHISQGRSLFFGQSADTSRLEHYTLAARDRLNQFDPAHPRSELLEKCKRHNAKMLSDWTKHGFAEEAFLTSPDLVDFVADAYLHRFIRYPDYNHTIEMRPVIARREGRLVTVSEPHLMMNGRMVPWSKISKEISIDEDGRLYSTSPVGRKVYWMYLENGLAQRDRHDLETLHPLKTARECPAGNLVQIVTSHYPRDKWGIADHLMQGNVHTHIRIIPRAGFSAAHTNSELRDGKIYSIGYGARWNDVSHGEPFKTIPGLHYNPDSTEFFKEDLLITPLEAISDEKLLKLVTVIKEHARELRPFNVATRNCCTEITDILKEAEVIDLKSEIRADNFFYKLLVPDFLKKIFATVGAALSKVAPEPVAKALNFAGFALTTLILSPILLILGAWKIKRPSPEDTRQGELKPVISSIADVFDTERFTVNLTLNVSEWQKTQPNTMYVEQN